MSNPLPGRCNACGRPLPPHRMWVCCRCVPDFPEFDQQASVQEMMSVQVRVRERGLFGRFLAWIRGSQ